MLVYTDTASSEGGSVTSSVPSLGIPSHLTEMQTYILGTIFTGTDTSNDNNNNSNSNSDDTSDANYNNTSPSPATQVLL